MGTYLPGTSRPVTAQETVGRLFLNQTPQRLETQPGKKRVAAAQTPRDISRSRL